MTDYGHPITFGLSLDPSADRPGDMRRLAEFAQETGLEYLAVQDHPYQPSQLDMWTLITHLAAQVPRISFLPDVADLQLRSPVMLAQAAATLSVLSGGRLALGVGGGGIPQAIAGMIGSARKGSDMVTFTEEALHVMRAALGGGPVRLHGAQHTIDGYDAGPVPPRPVPLWLGAQMPRMLGVAGRGADGWISPLNIYVPPQEVPTRQALIDDAARNVGRDPASVRRIYNVIGTIGSRREGPGIVGNAAQWIDTLAGWSVDLGFDTFIFWPIADAPGQAELFATEVVPGVRAQVAQLRGQR
jgi:alkanesulfonate monooxygenase SsuD/methylene tetrahydromethanopterin reductase-like flavin-dependent oxidoreductase (luciferase family)